MDKPNREQVERFWEWCGFKHHTYPEHWHFKGFDLYGARWIDPDKSGASIDTPALDLNNLFKYAVPKLHDMSLYMVRLDTFTYEAYVCYGNKELRCGNDDPALALFWAIYKVMDNGKT